tara:strand:- start:2181 stop:2534 length:354 start_codon:yes stop_codon:yes gene_type:complete
MTIPAQEVQELNGETVMEHYCVDCGFLVDDNGCCGECTTKVYDPVAKPSHYNQGDGIECIEYIKQVLGPDGFVAYCRGNMMKYNHRAMYKGNPAEDLAKAAQYLNWVNETLSSKKDT